MEEFEKKDLVVDIRESWSEFFARIRDFKDPKLIPRDELPEEFQPHRSFFGKPWTYGATHPGTKLWRQLASDVNPKWRRSFDSFNYLRGKGARFAKMTKTDTRMIQLTKSSLQRAGDGK